MAKLFSLVAQDDVAALRDQALTILGGRSSDASLAVALQSLAYAAWNQGHVSDALDLIGAAVSRSDRMSCLSHQPRLFWASMLTSLGNFEHAEQVIGDCRVQIERAGGTTWATAPFVYASRLDLARGRADDASKEAQAGLAVAERNGTRQFVPALLAVLASTALCRGDLGEASRLLQDCRRALPSLADGTMGHVGYRWVGARVAEARIGPARAVEILSDVYDDSREQHRLLVEDAAAPGWMTRSALAVGERDRAKALSILVLRLSAGNRTVVPLAAAATQVWGLVHRDAAALRRASTMHLHPLARASAVEDLALVLAAGGNVVEARDSFETCIAAYTDAGAAYDAAKAQGALSLLGTRRRIDRSVSGWASLTPSEIRVAEAVASGLTNAAAGERMFLSRHTVDFHLRQIFRKLGIHTRVELTRYVLSGDR